MGQGENGEQAEAEPGTGWLGPRIKELRTQRGWSLRKLARQAGLSHTHVAQIESGAVADPSVGKVMGIARALGVPVGHLLGEVTLLEPQLVRSEAVIDKIQADLQAIQRFDSGQLEVVEAVTSALRKRAEQSIKDGRTRKPTPRE